MQIIRLVGDVFSSPEKLGVCFSASSNSRCESGSSSDHMEVEEEGAGTSTSTGGIVGGDDTGAWLVNFSVLCCLLSCVTYE